MKGATQLVSRIMDYIQRTEESIDEQVNHLPAHGGRRRERRLSQNIGRQEVCEDIRAIIKDHLAEMQED